MPATEVDDLAQISARLEAAVREAGALALSMFGTPLKNWTKGPTASPVSEADIAVDDLLRERLTAGNDGIRLAVGGKRRRSGAARRTLRLDRRSDRRHPRLYRRLAGLGGVGGAGRRTAGRSWPAFTRRSPSEFFVARANAGATCNGTAIAATTGAELAGARIAGPRSLLERLAAVAPPFTAMPRVRSLALRLARSRTAPATSPLPAATATTGTLRRLIFWCTKRAAH